MENRLPARFRVMKAVSVDFSPDDPLKDLWHKHDQALSEFVKLDQEVCERGKPEAPDPASPSLLDLKHAIALRLLESCRFCPRYCGVNRRAGQRGYCQLGDQILVSTAFDHWGEEPELVPSFTVFTIGCNLRCLHCQNWTISQRFESGTPYTPREIAFMVDKARREGCRNLNMVGGDPTPWLHAWLEVSKYLKTNIPLVWNSNSYYSEETAKLLAGWIDVYLLDFKYGNDTCAKRISDAPGYWEVCTRNHLIAKKWGELIIRILVLPQHLDCCLVPILEWIANNLGRDVRVNIMFQYRPEWRAHEIPELRRRLTRQEMQRAVEEAKRVGLTNYIT
ncbi:radical SAM protein [archaeon]|nr:radical SAM protein [archaeon]